MREHKYQAWHKRQREMFEVSAIQFRDPAYVTKPAFVVKKGISGLNIETYTIDEVKLREFTGLKDKHGKEIYEGDILGVDDPGDSSQAVVEFHQGGFKAYLIKCHLYMDIDEDWIVTSNIYENPESIR